MRLQLITHSYLPERTPPQRRWSAFVEAFREAGWDVDVVVPSAQPGQTPGGTPAVVASPWTDRGPAGERLARTLRLDGLSSSRNGRFAGHVLHAFAAIPRGLALPRPDVVVITVPALPTVITGWVVSRLRRVPLIVEMRDAWPDLARESAVEAGALSLAMERLVTGVQRSADLVVTVTRGFATTLAGRGIRPVAVVGNGVELDRVPVIAARDRRADELNVLYMGNHGESQGLETLIRAASLAERSTVRIRVRMVGSGTQKEALRMLNEALGAPVEMLDPVHGDDLTAQYAWADTCVVSLRPDWPSFAWTIPSKTYEVLAVGRHITGVVTGEAAEVLRDSGSADVVGANPHELLALWERLAVDPASTATSGRGRLWVTEHADLPRLGEHFVHLTSTVVGTRRSSEAGLIGRVGHLGRNICLAAGTATGYLRENPAILALQASRRLPSRWRTRAGDALARISRGPLRAVGALGLAAAGRTAELQERAHGAVVSGIPPRGLVHYAEVLLATEDRETAERLLDQVSPGTRGLAAARSRWSRDGGRLSEALQALGPGPSHRRQRQEIAGELAALSGSGPVLDPVVGYRPEGRRVLHVLTNSLPHSGSGYAQRSHAILSSLREAGWDVSAVTRLGWPVETGIVHAADVDTVDGIEYRRLLPARPAIGLDARLQQYAQMLLRIVLDVRPALLHTTTDWTNAAAVQAVAEATGIPWVFEVRGQRADTWASTRGPEARQSEWYRLSSERDAASARAADAVVTLGRAMRDHLVDQGISADRIELCPNAVGGPFLDDPGTRASARQSLGLDPSWSYVGTVSSIVPYEGLDTLVHAVAALAPERPDLRLLLVGDGTSLPSLLDLADKLGIADRVIAPGRVDRSVTALYYRALDVFVVPRRDTEVTRSVTPLKPVEASASALPVVASDLPALAELVDHGTTGLLVRPGDAEDLAAALDRLLTDSPLADRMGRAGRQWALAERTWSANAERYGQIYRSLLAEARPGAAPAGAVGPAPL